MENSIHTLNSALIGETHQFNCKKKYTVKEKLCEDYCYKSGNTALHVTSLKRIIYLTQQPYPAKSGDC